MPATTLDSRIIPAVTEVFRGGGVYRCERDLHHHLTAIFERQSPLRLGTSDASVRYEHPTTAKYNWSKRPNHKAGNIDMYFMPTAVSPGVAVELNYGYHSPTKIKQDLIKLTDPKNGLSLMAYIAVSPRHSFNYAVALGIEEAFSHFYDNDATFQFPVGLSIFAIGPSGRGRILWRITAAQPCDPAELDWSSEEWDAPVAVGLDSTLTEDEARRLLQQEMRAAGIRSGSTTASCMFEATQNQRRQNVCQFGPTPLWEHVVVKRGGLALRSEFVELVQRLCRSGRRRMR